MNLIIDTSSEELKVILYDEKLQSSCEKGICSKHQQHLLEQIDKVLLANKLKIKDIQNIGVVVGPGSFTGVRLAVATAKAFAYLDRSKNIVSINMLDLLGKWVLNNKKKDEAYYVFIKCTSSKCYIGKFTNDGKKEKYFVETNENIKDNILCENALFYGYKIDEILGKELHLINLENEDYVEFVNSNIGNKNFTSFDRLEPLYMALSQAEEELLKREKSEHSN